LLGCNKKHKNKEKKPCAHTNNRSNNKTKEKTLKEKKNLLLNKEL
jgi:hypothetical protein